MVYSALGSWGVVVGRSPATLLPLLYAAMLGAAAPPVLALSSSSGPDDGQNILLGPSFSYHQQRTHAQRPYNENNPGLGLAWRKNLEDSRWQQGREIYFARDSFDRLSLFAGATLTRELWRLGNSNLHVGAQAGVAYKYTDWDGPHKLRPFLAALASIRWQTGANANLSYAYHRNANTKRVNGVFVLQFAYEI